MATLKNTTGILLGKRDFREADRIYSVLTMEYGKLELLGRGARKSRAKLSSHLEFACEADFFVVFGKVFDTVAGVERQATFQNIYKDFSKTLLLHQALQLVDLCIKPRQVDILLYDEIRAWLYFLDMSPVFSKERSGFLLAVFTLKLLSLFGHHPQLNRCVSCQKKIVTNQYRWHALRGGVVCKTCIDTDSAQWFSARSIQDETLKLLRLALEEPYHKQLDVRLSKEQIPLFHDLVESLVVSHFPTIPMVSLRETCSI